MLHYIFNYFDLCCMSFIVMYFISYIFSNRQTNKTSETTPQNGLGCKYWGKMVIFMFSRQLVP